MSNSLRLLSGCIALTALCWLLPATRVATQPRAQSRTEKWRLLNELKLVAASPDTAMHGNALFAAGYGGGLFRSDDGGQSWIDVSNGLPNTRVMSMFSFGPRLFVGLYYTGLFVTTDNGATWSRVAGGFNSRFPGCFLVRGGTLFVGADDTGVLRSGDGGVTWTRSSAGLPISGGVIFAYALAASGENLLLATDQGVFLSSDNGQNWREPQQPIIYVRNYIDDNGFPVTGAASRAGVNFLLANGATILAGTYGAGVFRSEDNGETWLSSDAGLASESQNLFIRGLARVGSRLLTAVNNGGVFCSDDGGNNWRRCQQGMTSLFPSRLFLFGDKLYAATRDKGLFLSTNRGESWSAVEISALTKVFTGAVRALTQHGTTLFALSNGAGLHTTTDGGATWITKEAAEEIDHYAIAAGNRELFRLTRATPNTVSALHRSTDDGRTWSGYLLDGLLYWNGAANPAFKAPGNLNAVLRAGPHLFVGTEQAGIKVAYDVDAKAWVGKMLDPSTRAKAWTVANTGLTNLNVQTLLLFDNRVFAGTEGGVFVSANNGQSWSAANTGLANLDVAVLVANSTHLFAGTRGGVFVSANGGQSWAAANNGLTELNIQALAVNGANLFAGAAAGVFHSADNGQSWRAMNDDLTDRNVTALLVNGMTLYAGTAGGRVFALEAPDAPARPVANVSAATYNGAKLAPASIVSAFGAELATTMQNAATMPLPTTLAGTTVNVKDRTGTERAARLFFVSPNQVNYLLPAESATGQATISITSGAGKLAAQAVELAAVAPGIFTADASGRGLAAAAVLRVKASGAQSYEPVARYDSAQGRLVPAPIDLGEETDQVFLLLFCTGARYRTALSAVSITLGGLDSQVLYAGPQEEFAGLDQLNVRLARTLSGRGEVELQLTVDGQAANPVKLWIR